MAIIIFFFINSTQVRLLASVAAVKFRYKPLRYYSFASLPRSPKGTVADPKLVFTADLKPNACNIILSHNHPSGNLKPSSADEELTKKIATAGIYLDIKVIDHIIVISEGYYSFTDERAFITLFYLANLLQVVEIDMYKLYLH